MSYLKILFLVTAVFLFGTHSVYATDYAVGTCEPKLTSYTKISDAVSLVPAGSIVEICPGRYAEQLTISKALTLEGITSGNSDQVIIAVPSGGLSVNASPYAAQVLVTAGPVNITNIIVDGTGNGLGGSAELAGIYYGAGSSGVIKDVTTRYQLDSGEGVGIYASNSNSTSELLTIEDCSVHDFDYIGILVNGQYTATIKANHVNGSSATAFVFGILGASAGTVSDNVVIGPGASIDSQGVTIEDASPTVTANTLTNWFIGFEDFSAASYTSNTLRNNSYSVNLNVAGAKVESNTITQSVQAGIELNCFTGTVKSNTINDAPIGLDNVPSGLSTTNTYFNVPSFRTACAGASPAMPNGIARRPRSE